MKFRNHGINTLGAEITQISTNGVWLLVGEMEYFLSYQVFPWFKDATISQVHNVRLIGKDHLHWPALDVDLELDCLVAPEKYPLVYR